MTAKVWRTIAGTALVFMLGLRTSDNARGEVIELEGVVKAVDKEARKLTIERKTPKGVKTLDLEVTRKYGMIRNVRVGADVALSYDPDLEIVTRIEFKKYPPMPVSEMIERLAVFDPPPDDLTPEARAGIALDQGYVFGYMTAVQEMSGVQLRGKFTEKRDALKQHLAEHPEDASAPAHVVMVRVLKAKDGGK